MPYTLTTRIKILNITRHPISTWSYSIDNEIICVGWRTQERIFSYRTAIVPNTYKWAIVSNKGHSNISRYLLIKRIQAFVQLLDFIFNVCHTSYHWYCFNDDFAHFVLILTEKVTALTPSWRQSSIWQHSLLLQPPI